MRTPYLKPASSFTARLTTSSLWTIAMGMIIALLAACALSAYACLSLLVQQRWGAAAGMAAAAGLSAAGAWGLCWCRGDLVGD